MVGCIPVQSVGNDAHRGGFDLGLRDVCGSFFPPSSHKFSATESLYEVHRNRHYGISCMCPAEGAKTKAAHLISEVSFFLSVQILNVCLLVLVRSLQAQITFIWHDSYSIDYVGLYTACNEQQMSKYQMIDWANLLNIRHSLSFLTFDMK